MDCSSLKTTLNLIPENSQNSPPSAPQPNSLKPDIVARVCGSCNKEPSPKRCTGCKSIYYCSVECQKAHWPIHKLSCKTLGTQVPSQPVQMNQPAQATPSVSSFDPNNNPLLFATRCRDKGSIRPDKLAELRQEGYQGLREVNLEEIITSKGYDEALKHIWTEDDYAYRTIVLEHFANNGHPLLMLELSQAFALCAVAEAKKNNKPVVPLKEFDHSRMPSHLLHSSMAMPKEPVISSDLRNSFKWYVLGHLCMNIDIQCLKDRDNMQIQPTQKAATILLKEYNPAWHIENEAQPVIHFEGICEAAIDEYPKWRPRATHPSPRWIIGGAIAPEKGWLANRNPLSKNATNTNVQNTFASIRVGACNHPVWDKMMK